MANKLTFSVTSGDKNLLSVLAKLCIPLPNLICAAHFDLSLPIFL
jgi:hypothetical protein